VATLNTLTGNGKVANVVADWWMTKTRDPADVDSRRRETS
jgi:hypothetical protein